MSRIGKKPVPIPAGVTAAIEGKTLSVKGAKGTLTLQTAGAYKAAKKTKKKVRLGRKSFSLKAGKSKTLSVKLTKKARRLVKRNKRLHARAIVRTKKKAGAKASKSSRTLTIRAPKKGKK